MRGFLDIRRHDPNRRRSSRASVHATEIVATAEGTVVVECANRRDVREIATAEFARVHR